MADNSEFNTLNAMNYAKDLRNSESSGDEGGASENAGSTELGVFENADMVQSLRACEKDFTLSMISEFIGLRNVEQASLFQMFSFLQNVMSSISLGNLSPLNLSKIPTGLFGSKGGNQK
jgi:hypothetical protein